MEIIADALGMDERLVLLLVAYLALVNGCGIIMMGLDKYYAKKNKWRISEKKFFITAALGGALGVLFGMKMFRHKTLHKSFTLGIPMLGVFNGAVLFGLYYVIVIK